MGLAKISLQTASGSSQAEMAIEGILEAEQLRDFLYSQMRGSKNDGETIRTATNVSASNAPSVAETDRATRALEDIRNAMQALVDRQETGGGS
jgi:putative membrane protein